MIAYKSKLNIFFLLIFSILFLGLGIWSIWFDMLVIYKVLFIIFSLFVSVVLFYTFIFYIGSPNEVIVIANGEMTIFNTKSKVTYYLNDIKEVSFNFNVPYLAIAFTFSIIKNNGEVSLIGLFINKQIKTYKKMKEILLENDIKITRTFHL